MEKSLADRITFPDGRSYWEHKNEEDRRRHEKEIAGLPSILAEKTALKAAITSTAKTTDPARINSLADQLDAFDLRPDAKSSGVHFDRAMNAAFGLVLNAIESGAFQHPKWETFRRSLAECPNIGSIGSYFRYFERSLVAHLEFRWGDGPRALFYDGIKLAALLLREEAKHLAAPSESDGRTQSHPNDAGEHPNYELGAFNGKNAAKKTRFIAALQLDPNISDRKLAEKIGISRRTAASWREKYAGFLRVETPVHRPGGRKRSIESLGALASTKAIKKF